MKHNRINRNEQRIVRTKRIKNRFAKNRSDVQFQLIVNKTDKHLYAQIVDLNTGKTVASSSTLSLKLQNANVKNAEIIGADIAKKASSQNISKILFNRNGYLYHGVIKALAEAARASGLIF